MAAEDDSKEEQMMPGRSAGNAEESQPFVVIGENVHTTRVVRRPGPLVKPDEDGRESIEFADEAGETHLLPIPPEELRTQDYQEGRVKHVRSAVRVALSGGADAALGLAYLHARRTQAGRARARSTSTSTSTSTRTACTSRSR